MEALYQLSYSPEGAEKATGSRRRVVAALFYVSVAGLRLSVDRYGL